MWHKDIVVEQTAKMHIYGGMCACVSAFVNITMAVNVNRIHLFLLRFTVLPTQQHKLIVVFRANKIIH